MKLLVTFAAVAVLLAGWPSPQAIAATQPAGAPMAAGADTETEASRRALQGFVDLVGKGEIRAAFARYATETYTQHEAGIGPGRDSAIAYIENERARGGRVKLIGFVANGNMVGVHLHRDFADGSPSSEVIEIWRVENGRLAEHWGITQDIPKGAGDDPKR